MARMTTLLSAALVAGAHALPAAAQTTGEARLEAAQQAPYGQFVADADGRALYMFTADEQGQGGTDATSNCYDACAEAWPPMLVDGEPQAGEALDPSLLGTIERQDGAMQVTYGGWPLYYYVQDQGPGSVTGQDVHGFGGEWYLVSPDGSMNEHEG